MSVLENGGAGAFTATRYAVDLGPGALAAGDFGADADPDSVRRDAVIANLFAGSVTVLGGYVGGAGYGSGGIAATGATPTAIAIADGDGDGFADLLYADAATNSVAVLPGVADARADYYGSGCPGTAGRVPELIPLGAPASPTQPNATFGVGLVDARPQSPAVIVAGLYPAAVIQPCSLLVGGIGATWVVLTNAAGKASFPLPVPPTPNVIGLPLHCQGGVVDPAASGPFFPGIALTRGLRLRVGT